MKTSFKAFKILGVLPFVLGTAAYAAPVYGDLFLGFRINATQTNKSDKYVLVDLGSRSAFTDAGTGHFATGAYSLDVSSYLVSAYGSAWNSNALLTWTLFSVESSALSSPYFVASKAASAGASAEFPGLTSGTKATGTGHAATTVIRQVSDAMVSHLQQYVDDDAVTPAPVAPATEVVIINEITADSGSNELTWGKGFDNGTSTNGFVFTTDIPKESYLQGVTNAENYADLRALTNGSTTSTVLGSFLLGSNGLLSVAPVPEPSTYGLIGAGALAVVAAVRRRRPSPPQGCEGRRVSWRNSLQRPTLGGNAGGSFVLISRWS